MAELCEMCNTPASMTCAGCNNSRYCSRVCRKRGWKKHKLLCSSFMEFGDNKRPTPMHRRAIYFPLDEDKPRFIWLEFERHFDDEDEDDGYDYPRTGNLLGANTGVEYKPIKHNDILDRPLRNTISLMIREAGMIDGSTPNRCTPNCVDGSLRWPYSWHGPMLAIGEEGLSIDPDRSDDLDMTDFRHIVDRLSTWTFSGPSAELRRLRAIAPAVPTQETQGTEKAGKEREASQMVHEGTGAHVQQQASEHRIVVGVRINCTKDVVSGRPKYEPAELSAAHPTFLKPAASQVSARIELPLRILREKHALEITQKGQADVDVSSNYSNPEASSLFLVCDPDTPYTTPEARWGEIQPSNQGSLGSVVVFRLDKKALAPEHVEALCRFCQYKLPPIFLRAHGHFGKDVTITKEQVLSEITKTKFAIYYDNWRTCQDGLSDQYGSPYTVAEGGETLEIPFVEVVDAHPQTDIGLSMDKVQKIAASWLTHILVGVIAGWLCNR